MRCAALQVIDFVMCKKARQPSDFDTVLKLNQFFLFPAVGRIMPWWSGPNNIDS